MTEDLIEPLMSQAAELLAKLERLDAEARGPSRRRHNASVDLQLLCEDHAATIIAALRHLVDPPCYTLSQWHEDIGDALWWLIPVEESPWVGSPMASDWPFADCDGTSRQQLRWTPLPPPPTAAATEGDEMMRAALIAEWTRLRDAYAADYHDAQKFERMSFFENWHLDALLALASRAVDVERLLAEADAIVYRLADYKEPLVSQRRLIIASIARHALRQKTEKS